jgi:hypothetical protein
MMIKLIYTLFSPCLFVVLWFLVYTFEAVFKICEVDFWWLYPSFYRDDSALGLDATVVKYRKLWDWNWTKT